MTTYVDKTATYTVIMTEAQSPVSFEVTVPVGSGGGPTPAQWDGAFQAFASEINSVTSPDVVTIISRDLNAVGDEETSVWPLP